MENVRHKSGDSIGHSYIHRNYTTGLHPPDGDRVRLLHRRDAVSSIII